MSFRNKFTTAGLTLCLTAAFGTFALAQTTQPAPPPVSGSGASHGEGRGMKGRGEGREGGMMGGGMRLMRELDLTDAQKQQARAIMERYGASTKAQREELRGLREQKEQDTLTADGKARMETLRTQLAESNKTMHNELLAILTPEQRAKLEKLEKEHRDERREDRREHRPGTGDAAQPGVQ